MSNRDPHKEGPAPAPRETGTLLVCCEDRPGLVAALAQVLFEQGVNIVDADQHTDEVAGKFFQRIRFDLRNARADDSASARFEEVSEAVQPIVDRYGMSVTLRKGAAPPRMAIFVSRTDHCLYDLLLRHRAGELACEIPLIMSNHDKLAPVAAQFGIAYHVLPVTSQNKAEQEAKQLQLIADHRIDLVVLARYMQILSADFVRALPSRIINIHHSFLPAFSGGRPYHQAYERGVKLIGATAHYATTDLDEGPIIDQDVMRVSHRDAPGDLVRKGRDIERNVLSRAVRLHLEDRILVYDNKTVVFD